MKEELNYQDPFTNTYFSYRYLKSKQFKEDQVMLMMNEYVKFMKENGHVLKQKYYEYFEFEDKNIMIGFYHQDL